MFAPTDQAFINTRGVASEAEAIAAVQSLPKGALTDILLYHVIDGRRTGTSVLAAPRYDTLLGETLTRAELGAAGVQAANISASNGVVHVLTTGVLLP
ncbi:MAG TPA: fasciclin domain-containing protein [Acidimicrobiia bacterium]|nr:fasciclin domain-containing protein [Acidimicrobiia bacterium]